MSDSSWPHGLKLTRFPCPSLSPRIGSNSCLLSWWCHSTISSSVVPFSSRPQSFPASGSFPMSQFFASGGQSIGASASASVLPMNIQGWFPLGLSGFISLLELKETFSVEVSTPLDIPSLPDLSMPRLSWNGKSSGNSQNINSANPCNLDYPLKCRLFRSSLFSCWLGFPPPWVKISWFTCLLSTLWSINRELRAVAKSENKVRHPLGSSMTWTEVI